MVAYSDTTARHVATACRRHGLNVPTDVAVVANMNETAVCLNPEPSLTSVDVGYERLGYEAARLLDRLMDGEPPPLSLYSA